MSLEDKYWNCRAPLEVGCRYSLRDKGKTFLITESNIIEEIIPTGNGSNITSIERIYIWNYRLDVTSDYGHWEDVTTASLDFFTLDHRHNTSLSMNNLDLYKWRGQAVKIAFGDGECVIVKVRGNIDYPVDVDSFKRSLNVNTATKDNYPTTRIWTTRAPTKAKRMKPTSAITKAPTKATTKAPTKAPTKKPTTAAPTSARASTPARKTTPSFRQILKIHGDFNFEIWMK